jgi:hypothetical protein
MPWFKMETGWNQDPAIQNLKPLTRLLFIDMITYAAANHTDGVITKQAMCIVAAIGKHSRCSQRAAEMQAHNILYAAEDGWQIRNYLKWQRSKAQIDALVKTRSGAGKLGGRPKQNESKTKAKHNPDTDTDTDTELYLENPKIEEIGETSDTTESHEDLVRRNRKLQSDYMALLPSLDEILDGVVQIPPPPPNGNYSRMASGPPYLVEGNATFGGEFYAMSNFLRMVDYFERKKNAEVIALFRWIRECKFTPRWVDDVFAEVYKREPKVYSVKYFVKAMWSYLEKNNDTDYPQPPSLGLRVVV